MSVISLTVTESVEQVVSGIPRFVTITANIASVIFYTLDGSTPTIDSTMYVSPVQLPTNVLTLTLSVFATNGTDSSPIISNTYQTDTLDQGARTSHSGTNAQPNSTQGLQDPYPFGSNPIMPGQIFEGAAAAGFTTDNPLLPETATGFDASGNPTGFVNTPLIGVPTMNQPIIYSTTDAMGLSGPGIGNLPPHTVQREVPPPEQANMSDKLFDPRALVIFQDFTKPNDPNMPVTINRQFYDDSNMSHERQGAYYNQSIDTGPPDGTFLRQHYNPTDQTLTYYYRNSRTNKWIISKTSFTPAADAGKYYNLVFGRNEGSGFVFQWIPFKANYLF